MSLDDNPISTMTDITDNVDVCHLLTIFTTQLE